MSISINDLKPFVNQEETISFNGLEIKVKKNISEVQRINISKQIANTVFDNSIDDEDSRFDNKDIKNMFLIASVIKLYTDVDCGDFTKYVDICETATTSGLYDAVLNIISFTEIEMFKEAINYYVEQKRFEILLNKLDEIKAESLEVQLSRFLQMAIDKIPNDKKILSLIKSAKKEFKGFDLNKLTQVKDLASALGMKNIPSTENLNTTLDSITDYVSKKQK
jgi:hypothetical protein